MSTGLFHSAWRKWERAEHYRNMLEADFSRLQGFKGDSSDLQLQHDKTADEIDGDLRISRATLLLGVSVPQLSDDFGLILGDAVVNYRSALDHLTWSLVRRFGAKLSPKKARQIQFPVHNSAVDFEKRKANRTPGVPDDPYRALFKRYQPYRRGDGPTAIRWLRRLSDYDKHREVIASVVSPVGVVIHMQTLTPDVIVTKVTPLITGPSPIKPGTPVAEVTITTPYPYPLGEAKMSMNAQFRLQPLLSRRRNPGRVLFLIGATTREILERFEAFG